MAYGTILNKTFKQGLGAQIILSLTASNYTSFTATSPSGVQYNGSIVNGQWMVTGLAEYGEYSVIAQGSTPYSDTVDITVCQRYFIPVANPVLNDNSWETISYASTHNLGQSYWSVGDRKQIRLNGTVGIVDFDNYATWVYIIGFNHNEALEGQGITFGTFKTAASGGVDVALVDSSYNSTGTSAAFRMNTRNSNFGGWEDSYMRNHICGTSKPSYSGTIIAAIPADLRNALKSVTKYTNNTGNSSSSGAVTATIDYFFLLAEYEVFGNITYSNTYEANYQQQYTYYSAGNSKVKYRHNSTGSSASWWLRSPRAGNSSNFVLVYTGGTVDGNYANYSLGFAPGFCV